MNLTQVSSLQAQSLTVIFPGRTYKKLTDWSIGAVVLTETYSQLASGALVTEAVIEAQGKKLRCKQVPNPACMLC